MSDAQKLIREVLDEHQFNWGSSGTSCSGKACRDWRGYPMQHRQHLAAEIDKALGGLRTVAEGRCPMRCELCGCPRDCHRFVDPFGCVTQEDDGETCTCPGFEPPEDEEND